MKEELPGKAICQLFGIVKSTYYLLEKQLFISALTDTQPLIQKVCVAHWFIYSY